MSEVNKDNVENETEDGKITIFEIDLLEALSLKTYLFETFPAVKVRIESCNSHKAQVSASVVISNNKVKRLKRKFPSLTHYIVSKNEIPTFNGRKKKKRTEEAFSLSELYDNKHTFLGWPGDERLRKKIKRNIPEEELIESYGWRNQNLENGYNTSGSALIARDESGNRVISESSIQQFVNDMITNCSKFITAENIQTEPKGERKKEDVLENLRVFTYNLSAAILKKKSD